jgi:Zn finger protein HypA/HybF involved in hydrogenase expression
MNRSAFVTGAAVAVVAMAAVVVCRWQVAGRLGGPTADWGASCLAAEPASRPADDKGASDGVAPNDMCHVCHIDFAEEKMAIRHAKAKVWCRDCHGLSAKHMSDENIGATRPDRVYKTTEVNGMCGKCHQKDKHPKLSAEKRAARLAAGKKAQEKVKERRVEIAGICTDCHGSHWLPPK